MEQGHEDTGPDVQTNDARSVLVIGASSGIGAATVCTLDAAGFLVTAMARRFATAARLRCEGDVSDRVRLLPGSVSRLDDIDHAVNEASDNVGRLSALVIVAGHGKGHGVVGSADANQWQSLVDTNLLGLMNTTARSLPALRKGQGHIIFIGSNISGGGVPGFGAYSATKAGVMAFSKTLRAELGGSGIRCTAGAAGVGSDRIPDRGRRVR